MVNYPKAINSIYLGFPLILLASLITFVSLSQIHQDAGYSAYIESIALLRQASLEYDAGNLESINATLIKETIATFSTEYVLGESWLLRVWWLWGGFTTMMLIASSDSSV
jgi:hypothetical protein